MTETRINIIDEVRGLCIILVVLYHAIYTLANIFLLPWAIEIFAVIRVWQPILPAMFILISGVSCHLSRSNIKRGLRMLAISAAMTLVLAVFMPSEIIWFGIIHFLAVMNLLGGALKKYIDKIPAAVGIAVFAVLFVLTYHIQRHSFGLDGLWSVNIPESLYFTNLTAPLGFYTNTFRSADYVPLLPWAFLFVIGMILGRYAKSLPPSLCKMHIRPLAFVGRHTMIIYLVHQPIIVGLGYLLL